MLTDGESSPVFQRLVKELELATDTWGWVASFHDPGLWELGVALLPGVRAEAAEEAIDSVLEKYRTSGTSARSLEKAKNGMEAGTLRMMAGTSPRARGLGESAVIQNRWQAFFEENELLQNVTTDDVHRVAKTYLRPEHRTVLVMRPQATDETV